MTQLLKTATPITIHSATLIDHVFHNQFFDNPDCGMLDAALTDHCATFMKLPFSSKKYGDTGTTIFFIFFIVEMQDKFIWKNVQRN